MTTPPPGVLRVDALVEHSAVGSLDALSSSGSAARQCIVEANGIEALVGALRGALEDDLRGVGPPAASNAGRVCSALGYLAGFCYGTRAEAPAAAPQDKVMRLRILAAGGVAAIVHALTAFKLREDVARTAGRALCALAAEAECCAAIVATGGPAALVACAKAQPGDKNVAEQVLKALRAIALGGDAARKSVCDAGAAALAAAARTTFREDADIVAAADACEGALQEDGSTPPEGRGAAAAGHLP